MKKDRTGSGLAKKKLLAEGPLGSGQWESTEKRRLEGEKKWKRIISVLKQVQYKGRSVLGLCGLRSEKDPHRPNSWDSLVPLQSVISVEMLNAQNKPHSPLE